jgi:RNA polymerase sigma factor (sigma-70 family)
MNHINDSNERVARRDIANEEGIWYESPEKVQDLLAWGRQKRRLLKWVRNMASRRLTKIEKECLELHFFQMMSYPRIAKRMGVNTTSVYRRVLRSIKKLQALAERSRVADGIFTPEPRSSRRRRRSVRRRD